MDHWGFFFDIICLLLNGKLWKSCGQDREAEGGCLVLPTKMGSKSHPDG